MLGPEVFDSAFREYTRRWAFKHPQPADFFRTMEAVSGRDLAWFWRGFFYTSAALDQSVESVKQDSAGSAQVTVANLGDAVMPVELSLNFDDGTTELVKLPVEIWYGGNRYVYPSTRERPSSPPASIRTDLPRCGCDQRRLEASGDGPGAGGGQEHQRPITPTLSPAARARRPCRSRTVIRSPAGPPR